jgi:hypothetical protein
MKHANNEAAVKRRTRFIDHDESLSLTVMPVHGASGIKRAHGGERQSQLRLTRRSSPQIPPTEFLDDQPFHARRLDAV